MSEIIKVTDSNYSDIALWQTGEYIQTSGVYSNKSSYYACTKDFYEVTPGKTYKITCSNSKYGINIAFYDANFKFINNTSGMNGGKTTCKSTAKYAHLSITRYNTKDTFANFKSAFTSGITITVAETTPDPKVVITYDKVDYEGKDVKTMTLEEKKSIIEKLVRKMITTADENHYKIYDMQIETTVINKMFEELKNDIDVRIALSCFPNPFLLVPPGADKKHASEIYMMTHGANFTTRLAKMHEVVDSLVEIIKDMPTDLDKVLYVHDYLVHNTTYNSSFSGASRASYILVEKKGMCSGFADAMSVVLNAAGVKCESVTSSAMNHEWNRVVLDGENYHVDACWDNTRSKTDKLYHRFFLRSDESMKATSPTHYSFYPNYPYPSSAINKTGTDTATSKRFDNLFLHDVVGKIFYNNGLWYYYDQKENAIMASDVLGENPQIVLKSNIFEIQLTGLDNDTLKYKLGSNSRSIKLI